VTPSVRVTARRAGAAPPRGKLRVHVHNDPGDHPIFRVTPAHVRAAARPFPGLLSRLAVTYSDDLAQLQTALASAEVLLAGGVRADDLGRRAPRLRWIQSTNAGVEKLVPRVPPGVVLTNASGVHGPQAAEFAVTALLMLHHRLPHFVMRQREARWDPAYSTPIAGRTVVVVGVGRIGSEVARLARRLGLRVIGVRRSGAPDRFVDRMYRPRDLRRVLRRADFVVVTTPLTPETRGLLGRRELDLLPRHAGLVNVGRAAVVDYDALADKLRRGDLGGAILDVFPEEPLPPESPLWSTPNLVITPHCGVDDAAAYVPRCLAIFFDNLRRYLGGRPLRNRIDPARGY
jgi:phosphoglycerate dehydrogenase-like enzyme